MLIFGSFRGQRLTLQVSAGMTVAELKENIKQLLGISKDFYRQDKKVLALTYAGADLQDALVFTDLGIIPGTNIQIKLKEEVKPVLSIHCSHNQQTINVFETIYISRMKLDQVRSIASMKTGLPIGTFRLVTQDGREMFDGNRLDDYGVDIGHTIMLENWDGWNEYLNLAIMGFTPQVIAQLAGDEALVRYQMRVALFIAAHFGHVDLARYLLKLGCRSDEATGYHPSRAWCQEDGHKDSRKCPVHEATLCGQLAVLKLFVYHDITCLKAKDGEGLEPINLALRNKIKHCASFLVSKQWSKINITKTFALRLGTYALLKAWCQRAKERALLKYGVAKSSLKRRTFYNGALVNHGVLVDGFSKSPMNGRTRAALQKEEKTAKEEQRRQKNFLSEEDLTTLYKEDPENYFRTLIALHNMKTQQKGHVKFPPRLSKLFPMPRSEFSDVANEQGDIKTNSSRHYNNSISDTNKSKVYLTRSEVGKLPPISSQRLFNANDQDLKPEVDISKSKAGMIRLINNSKGAYFQSSSTASSNKLTLQEQNKQTTEAKGAMYLYAGADKHRKSLTAPSVTSGVSFGDDSEEDSKTRRSRLKKKKERLSDAMLLSKAKSSEGGLPLPLVSHEQARRPFFYHHGQREDELVESTLGLVSKYRGDTSRERAIKSLTLAKTFTGKPWLGQVRVALNLTNNNLRRTMPIENGSPKTNVVAN
ncbi:protein ANKUB1 [Biomphalaria pfeifferi]|uniref:Protein ANKUB1 n=1 Tax=Biomphalaria pfeifferi TaxID=112525 RepID=A0AAD8CB23_BIOPF|nr:protein ANKUB1 [Biomphalaria pfeifferi]